MASFEDLDVWKRAVKLSVELYRAMAELRDYGFRDQITRAGLLVARNIAEGMERETKADKIRMLTISRGSCGELRTQICIGMDIGYVERETGERWLRETREVSAMLVGLMRSIANSRSK